MGLLETLTKNDKKGLFKSDNSFVNYLTGYLPLDYANGFMQDIYDDNDKIIGQRPILGIIGGTFTTIIGYSGSGKTTLAQQIAWNIVKGFEDGICMHIDTEKTALHQRICDLVGISPKDKRFVLNKYNTTIEDVLEIIESIAEAKDKVNSLMYDYLGTKVYVPTVLIIDSLYPFSSKDLKTGTLEGATSGGRDAALVAQFYKKALNAMIKYNITVICTNHLRPKITIDPYASAAPQLMVLKKDEQISKGYAPIYLAQNLFRCSSNRSNAYTIDDNGFEGFKSTCEIAKTKTTFVGSKISLAFNPKTGFDPIYTLYEFANDVGIIEGRNPYLLVRGMNPSHKFNRKDFINRMQNDEDFSLDFMQAIEPYLKSLVGSNKATQEELAISEVEAKSHGIDLAA